MAVLEPPPPASPGLLLAVASRLEAEAELEMRREGLPAALPELEVQPDRLLLLLAEALAAAALGLTVEQPLAVLLREPD